MKFLIDSSLWIEYLREADEGLCDRIDELLDADVVYVNATVMGELLYGTKNDAAFDALLESFRGLHLLDDTCDISARAARVGAMLRREGNTVPLSDLMIAAQCIENDLCLLTRDRHFALIGQYVEMDYRMAAE